MRAIAALAFLALLGGFAAQRAARFLSRRHIGPTTVLQRVRRAGALCTLVSTPLLVLALAVSL
ncbi:hypothetical protein [Leifsonia sp. Le1]|uniref:hypothetical protein n=1 Tax=Leifsonia sp. Le1 TaxID=3404918 RepID=UPI003EBD6A7D